MSMAAGRAGSDALPALLALGLVAALLLLNPLTYATGAVAAGLFPDSITYLAFSREVLRGTWVLAGWGHVDSGMILPPVYPALVAAWEAVTGDRIAAAHAVSTAALLLATVPLALLALRRCGAVLGFAAVAIAQLHPFFLEYGTAALTESVFVLVLAGAALAALRLPVTRAYWPALLLGIAAGLLFLVRSLGGFLWPALVAIVVLRSLGQRPATMVLRALLVSVGFAAVLAPYAVAVHAQSGQWPVMQHFRLHRYVVTEDTALAPAEPAADYEALYAERREQRRLNGAGTEMLGSIVPAAGPGSRHGVLATAHRAPGHLVENLTHLARTLGPVTLALLLLTLATPLWRGGDRDGERWVLPVILLSYLGALSLVSGAIARYVEVLVPFVWIQIFAEAWRCARPLRDKLPQPAFATAALGVGLAALCLLTLPRTFAAVPLAPRVGERGNPLAACADQIAPGAPVFSFHPMPAYLLGGTFRVVPNDTLPRVAAYGARTGTHYLLLTQLRSDLSERSYYEQAPWARDAAARGANPHAEATCATEDGIATLYRLRP